MTKQLIKRNDFIRHLVDHAGLTYVQAEQTYSATMRLFEHALATRSSVKFARIGVLEPQELAARRVTMGFKKVKGKVVRCRREFYLGARTSYTFNLHRAFARTHGLYP